MHSCCYWLRNYRQEVGPKAYHIACSTAFRLNCVSFPLVRLSSGLEVLSEAMVTCKGVYAWILQEKARILVTIGCGNLHAMRAERSAFGVPILDPSRMRVAAPLLHTARRDVERSHKLATFKARKRWAFWTGSETGTPRKNLKAPTTLLALI